MTTTITAANIGTAKPSTSSRYYVLGLLTVVYSSIRSGHGGLDYWLDL